MQDDYSYLTPSQIQALEHFISHFKDYRTMEAEMPGVKGRFLRIWNILYPLYEDFNKVLREKNMAYEGMAYRELARNIREEGAAVLLSESFPGIERYVFVGLNALNECEKTVMRKMRNESIAEFCWDYSSEMIRDRHNRSSMFMHSNVEEFPQACP